MVVKLLVFSLWLCGPCVTFGQTSHSVTLSWSWEQGNGGVAAGFNIKRGTVSGGPYTQVGAVSSPTILTYIDAGPFVEGYTYYYIVTAVGPGSESPPSAEAGATIPISPSSPIPPTPPVAG